jgi:Uma2 family endonuclease
LRVKSEFNRVLGQLERKLGIGYFIPDGLRVLQPNTDLSAIPDGTFILYRSIRQGRVHLVPGAEEGYVRVEGGPDMVLEVVSTSSARKDKVLQRQLYWGAGVREYWIADARRRPLTFEILRHTSKGYVPVPGVRGWFASAVFGKSFRLTQRPDPLGNSDYRLGVR